MKRVLLAVLFVSLASIAHAQAPNITGYSLETYGPGVTPATGQPIQSTPYTSAAVQCNQTAPTVPNTVANPTRFFFDDAANPGKVCIGSLTSTYLQALPNGSGYTVYLTQTDNLGQTSARSAVSNPFGKQGIPAILTNLKVVS